MKENKHLKRFISLILILSITSSFSLINPTSLMAKNNQDYGKANRKVDLDSSKFISEVSPLTKTSSQPQEQIFTSYAPHWSTKSGFETTIYIRNVQVNNPVSFRLSLVLKHRTVQLAEQIVPPTQTVSISVEQELLANGEQAEEDGGATIDFGANSAGGIDAWLQQINETKSLSLSFPFLRKKTSQGKNLDAVILYYNRNTDAYISLQNTINAFVRVTPQVFINGQIRQIGTKRLKPFEVVSVKVPRFNFDTSETFPFSLGIRLNHNADDGAIVAQGWTLNDQIGFSAPFGFHLNGSCNCSPGKTRHVYGTGIPIGDGGTMAPGAIFEPLLNLRNNSNSSMTITPVIKFPENQTFRKITLPTFTLTSQQTIVKNLRQYQLDGTIPASVKNVDLDLGYQGSDGSLITELSSIDVNGSFVTGIPLTCSGHSAAHAAFWRTDGDWDSMLTVANISGVENEVEITISYGGGLYKMVKVLAVDETFMFSVKELQENQTPDINGNVIPTTATSGGMNVWTPNVNNGVIINGMVFNPVTKTCGYCGAYGYVYEAGVHEYGRNCGQTAFADREVGDYIGLHIWLSLSTGQCGSDTIAEITVLTPLILQIDPNNEGLNTIAVGSGDFRVKTQNLWADDDLACDLGGGRQLILDGHVEVIPTIKIFRDGTNITNSTQTVVIGQRINLSTSVQNGTPTNLQWTIPPEIIKNYIANISTGTKTAITSQDLNQSSVQFYWINGSENNRQVTYAVTVNGRQYLARANFNVKQPTITSLNITHSVVTFATVFGEFRLRCEDNGNPCVSFTAQANNNGIDGSYQWVQTYNESKSIHLIGQIDNCTAGQTMIRNGEGLDVSYPYISGLSMNDSPNIRLLTTVDITTVNDSAKSWLMFKPNLTNSIWIPLKKIDWAWAGNARRNPNNPAEWQLISYTDPNPTVTATTFPEWTRNVSSNAFQCQP